MKETPSPSIIRLEAPEYLEPGQNLYDQPPFKKSAEDAANETGTEPKKLCFLTTSYAETYSDKTWAVAIDSIELSQTMQQPSRYEKLVNLRKALGKMGVPDSEQERYEQAVRKIGASLEQFPWWNEYIVTQRSGIYGYYGEYLTTKSQGKMTVGSYARWAWRKIVARGHQTFLGIADVFPQNLKAQPLSPPPLPQGQKNTTRSWRILEASELTKRKR